MVVVLSTHAHIYTHKALSDRPEFDLKPAGYHGAFRSTVFPVATYVFTDMDRLSFWELELAAKLYRLFSRAGLKVLNDPAQVLQRFALLRRLKDSGLNSFDVWRADEAQPDRYPVFLRTRSAHRGAMSELLHGPGEVDTALANAVGNGLPLHEIMLVEYKAEPLSNGVFRKLAAFRVGDVIVPALAVHDSQWVAKYGTVGIASPEVYADERQAIEHNRYAAAVMPAFELARIDYGRVDFALVEGKVEVYEINTNPTVYTPSPHPNASRQSSDERVYEKLLDAWKALDTTETGFVKIKSKIFTRQRFHDDEGVVRWTP